jgi:hypothetical protein
MATDLRRVKSTTASKYDALVASQLKQAQTRIRVLDLTASLLGFAALSLAYIVGMVLCDSKLLLSPSTRQLSLYVFLAGAAVYLYWAVIRPLRLRVNPYYAARQVEQQLSNAKNSIVNWVDLHEQTLPPAIRGALSQRAAKDLSHVDLDRAISGRRAAWMGSLAGLCAIAFIASFFLLGPRPFLSLLQRTFNPFAAAGVSTRTQLTLLKPEGGNATVTVGRGVNFVVEVNGKVPNPRAADAVKLLYRYEEGDPWLERMLIQEPSRDWTTSLSAVEVKNGFWYKITGGDAETEEYRVSVRAAPAITDFLATYHFRPYVARVDEIGRERDLKALRGTEILLRVRTNRALREGRLEFEGKDGTATIRGEVDPNDPHTLLVRFVLDTDGRYRLIFTSTDSEAYRDFDSYPVTAIPDRPPTVDLTKPGKDIRLPVDALLHLEGKAGDDIGVKSLVLRMRVVGGDKLSGKPYRSDEELRLADGGYPREMEYKDFIELSRVKSENGQPFPLHAGMELEYWLQASDACDYPHPNVAESKHYRVLLTDPEKNQSKEKQEKQQAEKDKQQHEQKQDQKLQKENRDRKQERQQQQVRNKEEKNKSQNGSEGNQGTAGEKSLPKEGGQANNGENKEKNGGQGENKSAKDEQSKTQQQSGEQSAEDQKIEEQIKKALEKKEAGKNGKGQSKPDTGNQGEGKGEQSTNPAGGDKSKGENKGAGKRDGKDTGEGKDKGQPQAGRDPSQGEGKGENAPRPGVGDKSEAKGGASSKQGGRSGEDKGKPEPIPQPREDKASGDPQASKGAGSGKPKPTSPGKDPTKIDSAPSEDKERSQGEREPKQTGEKKDNGAGNSGDRKNEGSRKNDGSADKQQSNAKPSTGQGGNEKLEKNENKQDAGTQQRDATTKEIQDLARRLESKDAREREQAKQQLQRIQKEAADPEAREKAGEALKKMGEPDGTTDKGPPKTGNNSTDKSKQEGKNGVKNEDAKGDGSSDKKGGDKDKGRGPGQKDGQDKKNGKGSSASESAEGSQNTPGGNTPGGGGDRRNGETAGNRNDASSPTKPAKPLDHHAAQIQLEDFAKRVNKDILKEAGVSEEAWKKYLESKRKQLEPREKQRPEGASTPQQANQLPSMGGRTIQPAASGQGDAHGPDRGQPPPGYRDAFRKFTKQMSEKKE